ncbi:unnamed protein product [Ilex paraguariensis]|uniref:Uncharacterized protein n=1 Tax=Ilex paraguariensis TaxID=185542 RepID=A0ABC8UHE8_9AQUA
MGRQSSDPTPVASSIALLQERFRQLQRVKEQREERDLLRQFSGPEQITLIKHSEPDKLPFHRETIFTSRSTLQDSLSLGLNLHGKHAELQAMKTSPLTKLWSTDLAIVSGASHTSDNSEVDTSLHL